LAAGWRRREDKLLRGSVESPVSAVGAHAVPLMVRPMIHSRARHRPGLAEGRGGLPVGLLLVGVGKEAAQKNSQ
jgi:hypothetical protein